MPIVINEFEIIAEPPASPPQGQEPSAASQPATPKPRDVQLVIRRQRERAARVRAH
jgi:hypothetical protein